MHAMMGPDATGMEEDTITEKGRGMGETRAGFFVLVGIIVAATLTDLSASLAPII